MLAGSVKLLLTPTTRVLQTYERPPRQWVIDVFVVHVPGPRDANDKPLDATRGGFDYETFKAEVGKLALPGQQVIFSLNEAMMAEGA